MAGLLSKKQPPEAGEAMEKPAMKEAAMEPSEDGASASPEEQEQYNLFVGNGMKMVFDKSGLENMVQSIAGDGNPVQGLGNTLAMLVMRLEDSAEQSGQEIPGDVKYHGSVELLEHLADLAKVAKIHDFSEEEMESALYLALDQYRVARQEQGKLPVEALKSDMNQLLQAEQSGNIDQVLPGLSDYAKQAGERNG